jgi:hypothetical protein
MCREKYSTFPTREQPYALPVMFRGTFAGPKMNLVKEPLPHSRQAPVLTVKAFCLADASCSLPGNARVVDHAAILQAPGNERRWDFRTKPTASRSAHSYTKKSARR